MMIGKVLFHNTSSHEIDFGCSKTIDFLKSLVLSGTCQRFSWVILMEGIRQVNLLNIPSYS